MFTRSTAIGMMKQAKTGNDMLKIADMIVNEYHNNAEVDLDYMQDIVDMKQEQIEYEAMLDYAGEVVNAEDL